MPIRVGVEPFVPYERAQQGTAAAGYRGERRGKGGRTSKLTAVPFFFVPAPLLALLLSASPAFPQEVERTALEVKAGVVASTPLLRDGDLSASVGAAPAVIGAYRQRFSPDVSLQVDAGYTFGIQRGSGPSGSWSGGDVGIVHLVASLRTPWRSAGHLRGGAGVLRYFADDEALFRGEDGLRPVAEAAVGYAWRPRGVRVAAELLGQAHRFGTEAIREEGGQDGVVMRAGLLVGIVIGGGR